MSLKIFNFRCANGHVFEAWLKDGRSESLPDACPVCGEAEVAKIPAGANIRPVAGTTRSDVEDDVSRREAESRKTQAEALQSRMIGVLREAARRAEDVGEAFPETVRNMEKGKTEKKLVRGICTPLEAADLRSEGIDVMPLPDEALKPLN